MRSARLLGLAMIGGLLLVLACGGGGGGSTPPGPTVQAPNSLIYTITTATYINGISIASNSPSSGGGAVTAYSVSPILPTGLNLSNTTGIISGTPTVAAQVANYVVTASNSGGSTTATLSITVKDPATGSWASTPSMVDVRMYHTATLLQNGKVLVAGGYTPGGNRSSAEIYDPTAGTWTATGSMSVKRSSHTATLLPNGKVLIAGGWDGTSGVVASAEIYDPATGIWSMAGSMGSVRENHTATLLPNGKVLIAGGGSSGAFNATAEIYDPSSGIWTATGNMSTDRSNHTATLLQSGKVLVTGGVGSSTASTFLSSSEIYDPLTGNWTPTGALGTERQTHTASLLPSGKVLVAAGYNPAGAFGTPLASSEIYDPSTGIWTATGSLLGERRNHKAVVLSNGRVLVVGGAKQSISVSIELATAEIYNPSTGTWSSAASMIQARYGHTVTILLDGKVIATGGDYGSGLPSTAEVL